MNVSQFESKFLDFILLWYINPLTSTKLFWEQNLAGMGSSLCCMDTFYQRNERVGHFLVVVRLQK